MKVGDAVAEILRREGVEILFGYPVNHLLEHAAKIDIRPVVVRQERHGIHMADAVSRVTSAKTVGVFTMQHGPGTENAFGGVAQAYADSAPIVVLPAGYARRMINVPRPPLVLLSSARTRWGSCHSSGRIHLNWRLIQMPARLLDYVVAHEVAHLVEMNHSRAFWRVVEGICPEWERSKGWLTANGNALHRYGE